MHKMNPLRNALNIFIGTLCDYVESVLQINMPSGAYVKMDVHAWGLNLYGFAPSEDFNKTSGLCGTFDGNTENDYVIQGQNRIGSLSDFVESWR